MNAIEAKASNGQPYNEALNLTRRFAPRRLTPARYKARVLTWKVWHGQIQLVRDAVKPVTVHRTLVPDSDLLSLDLAHPEARDAKAPGRCHSPISQPSAGSTCTDGGRS
jgi:hypothetical protein